MTKTAVVILNWNGIGYLKKFLGRVIQYSKSPDTEIIVADNGSVDGSAEWLAETHKDVRVIQLDKNYGFAEGYNRALESIAADYYVLLNSDIEVTPGWIFPLTGFLDENHDAASCQPKILSYYRRDHFEYAGAAGGYIDKYGFPFCRGRIFSVVEKDEGQYNDRADVFWSTGACMAVRASAWKKCGGFDPSFFAHMEEIDLCWRFHKAGYRVCYIPESFVYHVGGGALPYDSPFKTYLNFRNSLYILYKNLKESELPRILFIRKLLDGVAAFKFFFEGRFASFVSVWKAHMDYYRRKSDLTEKRKSLKLIETGIFNAPVLNKSIVFEFYAKGKKTFSSLDTHF